MVKVNAMYLISSFYRYFDRVGEWEQHFSAFERKVIIYVGATAMYFVGKMLKKK